MPPDSPSLSDHTSGGPRGEMVYLRTAAIEALDRVRGETLSDRMLKAAIEIEEWKQAAGAEAEEVDRLGGVVERLREALQDAVSTVEQGRTGTVGDRQIHSAQVNTRAVERWRRALKPRALDEDLADRPSSHLDTGRDGV